MQQAQSPPIAVADATPWTWRGNAPTALEYQVRFYASAGGLDELAQSGGRTVSLGLTEQWFYESDGATRTHASTLVNTPPTLIPGGVWHVLGTALGQGQVTFTAVQGTEPAGATHYRILVKSR